MIPIYVGLDRREPVVHHVFCHSVATRTRRAVAFSPVTDAFGGGRRDGSTDFTYGRFLVPHLAGFKGWAIFADGDMLCRADIADLWNLRDERYAVMVARHDYSTRHARKMDGVKNDVYPRKNWSSLMLWNCAHPANRVLSPGYVEQSTGVHLHRFAWLSDPLVGALPLTWNWLVGEYPHNDAARLLHYTLGAPCFKAYENCDHADEWHAERLRTFGAEERCAQAA